ncbi:MAG: FtsW/RodA/SpoVE family cell cycle protein [Desulfobulbaceae bacterium]|nr:FtsW/RodA/SpoVE family cell cycle protein [Desulfobulbaceae bacterium]
MKEIILSFTALFLFAFLGYSAVSESQSVNRLDSLVVSKSNAISIFGARELGQRPRPQAAARQHLALRQQSNAWQIANISPGNKPVDVQTDSRNTIFLKRMSLEKNDQIQLGKTLFEITSVFNDSISLTNLKTGHTAQWRDGQLALKDQETSYPSGWWTSFKQRQRWNLRSFNDEQPLFSLGGTINLHNQWAVKDIPPRGAWIVWDRGSFFLAPGEELETLVYKSANNETPFTFHDQWLHIDGPQGKAQRLVIGKTYYNIMQTEKGLEFIPTSKIDVFSPSDKILQLSEGLNATYVELPWIGSGKPFSQWIAEHKWKTGGGIILGIGLAILIWHLTSYYETTTHHSIYFSCVLLFGIFLAFSTEKSINLAWLLGLCWITWAWASFTLFANGKLNNTAGWLWICIIFLAGSGVLLQLQLFAGADNTRWGIFAWKQTFYVALLGWIIGMIGNIPVHTLQTVVSLLSGDNRFTRSAAWLKVSVYLGIIILLLIMVLRGDEQGMGLFQPSELMKFVLVALAADTAMDIWDLRSNPEMPGRNRFRNKLLMVLDVVFILGLMTLTAIVSFIWVRDISPVLIILGFFLFWLWKISTIPHVSRKTNIITFDRCIRAGILLVILTMIIAAYHIHENPQEWAWLPKHDRFATWSEPQRHSFSGFQVNGAMRLVGYGGWLGGEDSWFGENDAGNELPAVQDDFALAFFLYKFGGLAGIILLIVQLCYLYLLSSAGSKVLRLTGNYAKRQAAITLSFIIYGLIVVHLLQWGISWGNTLGLIPVMGQPMTWLSSGNSHLISIGFPTLALGLLACWMVGEEEQSRG